MKFLFFVLLSCVLFASSFNQAPKNSLLIGNANVKKIIKLPAIKEYIKKIKYKVKKSEISFDGSKLSQVYIYANSLDRISNFLFIFKDININFKRDKVFINLKRGGKLLKRKIKYEFSFLQDSRVVLADIKNDFFIGNKYLFYQYLELIKTKFTQNLLKNINKNTLKKARVLTKGADLELIIFPDNRIYSRVKSFDNMIKDLILNLKTISIGVNVINNELEGLIVLRQKRKYDISLYLNTIFKNTKLISIIADKFKIVLNQNLLNIIKNMKASSYRDYISISFSLSNREIKGLLKTFADI